MIVKYWSAQTTDHVLLLWSVVWALLDLMIIWIIGYVNWARNFLSHSCRTAWHDIWARPCLTINWSFGFASWAPNFFVTSSKHEHIHTKAYGNGSESPMAHPASATSPASATESRVSLGRTSIPVVCVPASVRMVNDVEEILADEQRCYGCEDAVSDCFGLFHATVPHTGSSDECFFEDVPGNQILRPLRHGSLDFDRYVTLPSSRLNSFLQPAVLDFCWLSGLDCAGAMADMFPWPNRFLLQRLQASADASPNASPRFNSMQIAPASLTPPSIQLSAASYDYPSPPTNRRDISQGLATTRIINSPIKVFVQLPDGLMLDVEICADKTVAELKCAIFAAGGAVQRAIDPCRQELHLSLVQSTATDSALLDCRSLDSYDIEDGDSLVLIELPPFAGFRLQQFTAAQSDEMKTEMSFHECIGVTLNSRHNVLFLCDSRKHRILALQMDSPPSLPALRPASVLSPSTGLSPPSSSLRQSFPAPELTVTASAPIPEPSPCPLVWQLNTGLRYPRELALSHNNDLLFCTDCHNHRVVVISTSDGQPLSAFGTKTSDQTSVISETDDTISFKFPWALAFSDSCPSHLWVSEYGSAQLQCFDISAYQFAFSSLRCCSPTSFSQKFNAPTPPLNVQPTRLRVLSLPDCSMGIAISDGRLFASSISQHCVRVFDELNLASLGEIPNAGNRGLCVDSQRRLVYCCFDVKPQNDKIDGAVTIHSSTPPFAFQSAITSVYNAYGVCVEPVSGCLYVTERWSNRVSLVIAP